MSDGAMILLVFALIALLGGGTTALVLLIARRARARKERAYTAETVGTVVRVRPGGVDRPTSGTVKLQGQDIFARTDEQLAIFRRREVGLVYQFYNLIPVLDVVENMTLPVLMDGRTVNEQRLQMLLRALKLTGREHYLPNQLSGGQQQRVAIGRALMNSPAVLLADEPTGNLDSKNSAEIMKLLRDSNRQLKQTLVVITHDEDIALMADRVIAIEDGRLVRDERRG